VIDFIPAFLSFTYESDSEKAVKSYSNRSIFANVTIEIKVARFLGARVGYVAVNGLKYTVAE